MGKSKTINGKRWCNNCNQTKPISQFYLHRKKPRKVYSGYCIKCSCNNITVYKRKLKRSIKPEDKISVALQQLYVTAYSRCKDKKMVFELDLYFLRDLYKKQKGKCFYTGTTMTLKPLKHLHYDPYSVSLDRINSEEDYLRNNVVLCCYGINVLKGKHSQEMLYSCLNTFYNNAKEAGKLKI